MIGVSPGAVRPNSTVALPVGSTLVLYTDGLVERRGEVLDVGFERLARACRDNRHLGVDDLIAALFDALLDDEPDDDVAVVVVRNQLR
ncbi:MAG: sensor protein [Marmoricola sp.]|nr:sensor protein [Marmoricola sp.]